MKTIGIIGGVGPEATAQFYIKLVDEFRRQKNQQPRVIVWNIAVPEKLEHDALVLGKNVDQFIPLLTEAARELEKAGADMIVLPCNTLHALASHIRCVIVDIPFISIIETATTHMHHLHIKKIGLVGSEATVKQNLFKKRSPNTQFVTIPHSMQKRMNIGLHRFVETKDDSILKNVLTDSVSFFKRHEVNDLLLACTDFHGLIDPQSQIRLHDTLTLLVEEAVKHALGTARKNMI